MINFFQEKKPKDFKCSREFWTFYSSFVPVGSDKTCDSGPAAIRIDDKLITDPKLMATALNSFFTNIRPNSTIAHEECIRFSDHTLARKPTDFRTFKFQPVSEDFVKYLLSELEPSSGPGISALPVKLFKYCKINYLRILTNLFNDCIRTNYIPNEWKAAIVTPLHKGKNACKTDPNSYRARLRKQLVE